MMDQTIKKLENGPINFKTNRPILELVGFLWDNRKITKFKIFLNMFVMFTGIAHYSMKILLDSHKLDIVDLMEIVHWLVMSCAVILLATSLNLKSHVYLQLHNFMKTGLYTYPHYFTGHEGNSLKRMNEIVIRLTKIFRIIFVLAAMCTQLKAVLYPDGEWSLPFKGWFPFVVDNLGKYLIAASYQLTLGLFLLADDLAIVITYFGPNAYLIGQLEILSKAIPRIFQKPTNKQQTLLRIKACVDHHNAIKRYFNQLQEYVHITLLIIAMAIALLICTVCFILTDPNSGYAILIRMLSLILPELCIISVFCWLGQRITDLSDSLSQVVYETNWYEEPVEFRKYLIIIMANAKKPCVMFGGGIQQYNLPGLREILQASYSCFNMLGAIRGQH